MNTRVRLRRLTEQDATKAYAGWFRDPDIRRWITHSTPTISACRDYIVKALADPDIMLWGIFVGRRHVGNIKAKRRDSSLWGFETALGLLIGDQTMRGRGIGAKAIGQAARWCFRHWKVSVVAAGVHPFNTRSMRVFEKSGFKVADPDPPAVWLRLEKP